MRWVFYFYALNQGYLEAGCFISRYLGLPNLLSVVDFWFNCVVAGKPVLCDFGLCVSRDVAGCMSLSSVLPSRPCETHHSPPGALHVGLPAWHVCTLESLLCAPACSSFSSVFGGHRVPGGGLCLNEAGPWGAGLFPTLLSGPCAGPFPPWWLSAH